MNEEENPLNHSSRSARHAAAECVAIACLKLFPTAQLVGGEVTDLGFFYDFILAQRLDSQFLQLIEQEALSLIREALPIKTLSMMRQNAIDFLNHHQLPLRAEALMLAEENIVELIQIGQFADPCPAVDLPDTKAIGTLKQLSQEMARSSVARIGGTEVTRISGVVFPNPQFVKKFIKRYEAAKKRDHRLLGAELDLYSCDETLGQAWSWQPKGELLRQTILGLAEDRGQQISTPRLISASLYKKLGLAKFFHSLPKTTIEGIDYSLAPDSSVAHALLYNRKSPSIDQLPVRYYEEFQRTSLLKESQLCGMLRSRTSWCAEEHLFCSPQQVHDLLISSLQFINKTIRMFGFETLWHLRGVRSRHAGTDEQWRQSTHWLKEALEAAGIAAEETNGSALEYPVTALYGPRIDVCLVDGLGREWTGP